MIIENPEVVKRASWSYESNAGIYAAVMVEGTVWPGDEVCLLD
jgi:MOSC domain-containing protein YiiM